MAMVVPGPFLGVVVDSGLHLGRPRLLAVPMGVQLPAGAQLVVAVPMGARLPAGVQLGTGAMAVAAGSGECTSRGRRSVRAAAAVLPDYASSGAGLFFGSAASSVALAAASRAAAGRASHGGVVVAATAGSPADGGGVDDDATPAEIDEEEKRTKEKEQGMKDGEGLEAGPGGRGLIRFQEWLLLPSEDGASSEEVVTDTIVPIMFTKEHVLKLIRDFHPKDAPTETFLVLKEKALIEFIAEQLFVGASLLEECMMARPPSPRNYEAFVTIGRELKLAATECQRGYLQSESLEKAVVAIKRLRATSLELPEDSLDRLDIEVPLPRRPRREFGVDHDYTQARTYFILMSGYTYAVMVALLKDLLQRPPAGYYDE